MRIIDLISEEDIECINALKLNGKFKVLLNPAEYFIYKTSKDSNFGIEDVLDDLFYAYENVHYVRLGNFISNFFYVYAKDLDNSNLEKILSAADYVEEIPFTKKQRGNMYDVFLLTFYDIDEIIVKEELNKGLEEYSLNDIKNLLDDKLQVEWHCFEDDECLYDMYVDKDKHSLYRNAEKVIFNIDYDLDKEKFVEKAFDLNKIRQKLCSCQSNK